MGPEGSNLKFSENFQDWFVLQEVGFKSDGYFVDIGAGDGITASNTYLLEKFYKWQGICVDPNPFFTQTLSSVRNSFSSTLCVHEETGKILPFRFNANEELFYGWNFRAGLSQHLDKIDPAFDQHFATINVLTISLSDLLKLYHAPKIIDYLSIDTEGSEYSILKDFDFTEYDIACITVEHSFTEDREKIYNLLTANGYKRVEEHRSNNEDWYLRK